MKKMNKMNEVNKKKEKSLIFFLFFLPKRGKILKEKDEWLTGCFVVEFSQLVHNEVLLEF